MYREGLRYKKAGVMLWNLSSSEYRQHYFYENTQQRDRQADLMHIIDQYNAQTNTGRIQVAAEGLVKPWYMRQSKKSKRYTTCWNELLNVNI